MSQEEWIIANVQHTAFTRVNYDKNNWKLLQNQLESDFSLIDSISRAQLIDDAAALGRAQYIDQLVFLNITKYLVNETNPQPFIPAINALSYFDNMLDDEYDTYENFKVI